jgi:hypothetical protein
LVFVMPPRDFWFEQIEAGVRVMHAPPSAVLFTGESGLGHLISTDFASDREASVRESWHIRSGGSSNHELAPAPASRIDDPVYQEIVKHEVSAELGRGLCALLTGSWFHHHFSAVFSLYRDREMPEWMVLDVDIADRCRGPVEKLATTYLVSGPACRARARRSSTGSVVWEGVDPSQSLVELIAEPPATIEISNSSSVDMRAEIRAKINPETHTQRLRYRWRWTSSSDRTR